MNWSNYWRQQKHTRKFFCDDLTSIDSITLFKEKDLGGFSIDDSHELNAKRMENGFDVMTKYTSYHIPVEKVHCNNSHYFRCPGKECQKRMRKLYYIQGSLLCRKCLNLGYRSQSIPPEYRLSKRLHLV